jgi:hypothetical protein
MAIAGPIEDRLRAAEETFTAAASKDDVAGVKRGWNELYLAQADIIVGFLAVGGKLLSTVVDLTETPATEVMARVVAASEPRDGPPDR